MSAALVPTAKYDGSSHTADAKGGSEADTGLQQEEIASSSYVRKPYVIEKLGLAVMKELGRVT
jgi:hypothetical protein